MKETIFSLFLIGNDKNIFQIGCVTHALEGTDEEKRNFLLSKVEVDKKRSKKIKLKEALSWEANYGRNRVGSDISLFEPFFLKHNASLTPFFIITCVVNGEIRVDGQHNCEDSLPLVGSEGTDNKELGYDEFDYLKAYMNEGALDIPQLLHDDHLEAIQILYSKGKSVSALKLLMVFIDTLGFIESGHRQGSENFINWLEKYTNLSKLNVTAEELWEFRNGVLHMTNTEASKNRKGSVDRLVPSLGGQIRSNIDGFKYFSVCEFMQVIIEGVGDWCNSYNYHREKFPEFIYRYDTLMSDTRRLCYKNTES